MAEGRSNAGIAHQLWIAAARPSSCRCAIAPLSIHR
ncbi:hypothetical protein ACH4E8_19110 [Streptomyces sp. NPDC017979]